MASPKSPYREIGVSAASILGNKDEAAFKRREKKRIAKQQYRETKGKS